MSDPFILALFGTVLLATLLPARDAWAGRVEVAATIGIVMLFFLHGAKLSRDAIVAGARNWRLHLAVLGSTFLLFPLFGIGFASLPFVDPAIAGGLLFLSMLPSTVQSSIAFTSIARGNVAAAVCSASLSNLLGIVLTPLLVAVLIQRGQSYGGGGVSAAAIEAIILQLLVPFAAGHLARPWIGGIVSRRARLLSLVDRGSILLVVYSAFGAAVVAGLWHRLSAGDLALIVLLCAVMLAMVLVSTWAMGRTLRFAHEDAVVLLFCGSKKSLASGVPIAGVLFAPTQVGAILLPVMVFHQIQLVVCAMIARRYAQDGARGPANA